jgi:hypothetical protein
MIMVSGKFFRKAVLFLLMSPLMLSLTPAFPSEEWGDFDVDPGDMPGNFGGEQPMDIFEEAPPVELVEVVVPKKRNGIKSSPKELVMVPFQASIKGTIQDETAVTGVNGEKKHLPPSIKRQEITPSLTQDIHYRVIENYFPVTPYQAG